MKKIKFAINLLSAALVLASCGGGESSTSGASTSSASTSGTPVATGFTVKFDTHGGSLVEDMVNITKIEQAPLTTWENHIFKGWYTTETYENLVEFPYVVNADQTLHAKWELYLGDEFLAVSTTLGTAKSYVQASYQDSYIEVKVNVTDNIIFNSYTDPQGLNGYNDNFELFVTPDGDLPSGLKDGEMIKIMVVPGVGYEVRRFLRIELYEKTEYLKPPYSIYSAPLITPITATTKLTTESSDGFKGYSSLIKIPYSFFKKTKEDMLGKACFYLAMRNTDGEAGDLTVYKESSYLGSEFRHVWTHLVLNQNNKLVQREVDTVIFGDSYTDMDFYKSFNADYEGKHVYTRGIGGTKASQWKDQMLSNVIAHRPNKVVIHIGVNDIDDLGSSVQTTFGHIKTMVGTIHEALPNCKIHWITITDNFLFTAKASEYQSLNNSMKDYANDLDWLNIIDFASYNKGRRINFREDGLHLNALGYNAFTKMIYEALGFNYEQGAIFGSAGPNETSRGFDLSNDNEEITTNGHFDQYAFVKDTGRKSFTFEVSLTALERKHNDPYPKMGLVIKGADKMLFYYVEMFASLSGSTVGYVYLENFGTNQGSGFNWGGESAQTQDVPGIQYTNGHYVTLKATYNNGAFTLSCDGTEIFTETVPFASEDVYVGLLSFNTAFKAINYKFN